VALLLGFGRGAGKSGGWAARGERETGRGGEGQGAGPSWGLSFSRFFCFSFLFQNLFPIRLLSKTSKDKNRNNSHKNSMPQHECKNMFLKLMMIFFFTKNYLFTKLNAHKIL
jgi:hypothetical protein